MHGGTERLFWELMALVYLDVCSPNALKELGDEGFSISLNNNRINSYFEKVISWDDTQYSLGWGNDWDKTPPLALLMHEIAHAWDDYHGYGLQNKWNTVDSENYAISWENRARNCFYWNVPGYDDLFPSKKYERSFESWNMPNSDAWIWGDAPGRGWAWDVYNWLW